MRKVRPITVSLVIAVILLAAGYAYWSETLTADITVSTGEFKVAFDENLSATVEDGGKVDDRVYATADAYWDSENKVTLTVGNMYPGASAKFDLKIKNEGTIPVVFDYANVEFSIDEENISNSLIAVISYVKYNSNGDPTGENKFTFVHGLDKMKQELNNLLSGLTLEKGQYIEFDIPWHDENVKEEILAFAQENGINITPDDNCIILAMSEQHEGDEKEDVSMKMDIEIVWRQHNAPDTERN